MKQYPTIQQWDELDDNKKIVFANKVYLINKTKTQKLSPPSIGQMIEFLRNDLYKIDMKLHTTRGDWIALYLGNKTIYFDNLCDALWEAVKYKLNN